MLGSEYRPGRPEVLLDRRQWADSTRAKMLFCLYSQEFPVVDCSLPFFNACFQADGFLAIQVRRS